MAQMIKNLSATQEAQVQSLGWEDPLRKGMAAHSSILAWRILWTEEPGGLQSTGMQRVRLLIFRGEKNPPTCLSQRVIFLPHSVMSCYHMIPLITIFSFIIQKVGSLDQEDPLEKGVAAHSSILAWRIPWTERPGGLQSMRLQRIGHD